MDRAGAIIGMPFSLEGFAFFTEAIFLGLFLYGWKAPVATGALAVGRAGRGERDSLGDLCGHGQCVDERADGIQAGQRTDH